MKLYVTFTSPYARLARIMVLEKGLQDSVEVIGAQTRKANSPYYKINPSGRVPYLVDDAGVGMEDSQLICAYLDSLDGTPRFHRPASDRNWAYGRLEARARSLCDGIAVWVREMSRPENERSPTILAHEAARGQRLANLFESEVATPLLQEPPTMGHLILAVALDTAKDRGFGDLTDGRPQLATWLARMHDRPSLKSTAMPP
ncbi:MAG TPA: glutathione S-transferase family protein [Vineibacter sp.]|nr:glutathione S-transferase family protein [Vineibacter sp.]